MIQCACTEPQLTLATAQYGQHYERESIWHPRPAAVQGGLPVTQALATDAQLVVNILAKYYGVKPTRKTSSNQT